LIFLQGKLSTFRISKATAMTKNARGGILPAVLRRFFALNASFFIFHGV
jgi:hypothetical protein